MRLAFTADLHLTTLAKNPERFQALSDILRQCESEDIQLLVIAGDLFDKAMANYADFEAVYQKDCPKGLKTVIIPGNHDHSLSPAQITGEGLVIYDKPVLQPLNNSRKILFLPYRPDQSMGEAIAPFAEDLPGDRWILVGHGDWTESTNTPDPYEVGSYMPFTRTDLVLYKPELVILGHIHLPQSTGKVHYPGSPCPLYINETGPRRFLILDTEEGIVKFPAVHSTLEFYKEKFVMTPGDKDLAGLLNAIQIRMQKWQILPSREEYVRVQVEICGTAKTDRGKILAEVKKAFSPYRFYLDRDPNLANLTYDADPARAAIAQDFLEWLEKLDWDNNELQPTKSLILEEALKTIYRMDQ